MSNEETNRRQKGYQRMRATMHLGMGTFYILAGSVLVYAKYFGAIAFSDALAYTLGSLMLVYGVFRIWRGWTDLRAK